MPDPDYRLLYLNARAKMDKLLAELEQLRAEMAKETEAYSDGDSDKHGGLGGKDWKMAD